MECEGYMVQTSSRQRWLSFSISKADCFLFNAFPGPKRDVTHRLLPDPFGMEMEPMVTDILSSTTSSSLLFRTLVMPSMTVSKWSESKFCKGMTIGELRPLFWITSRPKSAPSTLNRPRMSWNIYCNQSWISVTFSPPQCSLNLTSYVVLFALFFGKTLSPFLRNVQDSTNLYITCVFSSSSDWIP